MSTDTLTLPFGGPADPTLTFSAPAEWHGRIRALAGSLVYGPGYCRNVTWNLREMSRLVEGGYTDLALVHLDGAERSAR